MTDRERPPISTGGGDDGTTTLLGAGRMSKHDARIVVLGEIDEASSFIGLARAEAKSEGDMAGVLIGLQRLLYRMMGDFAMPNEENTVKGTDVEYLDATVEEWRGRTELPNEFVIPGETSLGAQLDVARSVVRRAERSLTVAGYARTHPDAFKVVNRLSDLLFVLARNADDTYARSREQD